MQYKSKQDILNAFREKFTFGGRTGVVAFKTDNAWEVQQWLLNALTEFENGIIEEGRKYADTQFNTEALTNFLDMLEKEKHT